MMAVDDGGYALPFEVISMLLLAAMIGCIVIAMREKKIMNNEQGTSNSEMKKEP
jgi:NADH-quinone oxidoreductase subunit J